jgi:arylsulfatase A-like enzyme
MKSIQWVTVGVLGILLLFSQACQKSPELPNVLVIMTDQQSVNTIGAYGSEVCQTPNLDKVAKRGMIFHQSMAASYPCSPSRASLLTGSYSHKHGVVTNNIELSESLPSLGNLLKSEGYATAWFGKYHLGGFMHRNIPSNPERSEGAERDRPWSGRWKYVRVDTIPGFEPGEEDYIKELNDGHMYLAVEGGTGEDEASVGFDYWVGGWQHYRDFLSGEGYDSIVKSNHSLGAHGTTFAPMKPEGFGDSWHAWSTIPEALYQEAYFVDEAINYLEDRWNRDQPFGMVLSFYGPHHPILPPKPWDDMYEMDQITLPATLDDQRKIGGMGTYRGDQWTENQFKDYIRRYYGFTSYIDSQIGRLLTTLGEMGELENTIVVFTSDHGDMAGEHGSIYKSILCSWDELLRVPLIFSYPPLVKENSGSHALVSNIDVLPTILELIGVEPPGSLDGESFQEVLRNPESLHRDILFTSVMGANFTATTREWKYNLNIPPDVQDELYDRINDPDEMNNLIDDQEYQQEVQRMKRQIIEWLKQTGHPYVKEIAASKKALTTDQI